MSLTTTDKIFLCIGLIDFGGLLVWIGTALYMACTKADEMLRYLKNCTGIMAISPLRHGGPWGKLMFIGGISGFISFAGFYLKRGKLSAEDLQDFPAYLKHELVILYLSGCGLLLVMLGLGVVVKLDLV